MLRRILALFIAVSLGCYTRAQADYLPHTVYRYQVQWQTMKAGYMLGELMPRKGGFNMFLAVESAGIVDILLNHHSHSTLETTYTKDGRLMPIQFRTESTLRNKEKSIHIDYDHQGGVKHEEVIPADKRVKRPEVNSSRKTMFNPLFASLEVHRHVLEYRKDPTHNNFKIPVYDARRLAEYQFTIIGRKNISVNHQDFRVIHVHFTRQLLEGYTKKEWKNDENERPEIDVYLTDDEQTLPIKFQGQLGMGTITATLSNVCHTRTECEYK
ncbi:MAG: DUF3108 domain-containing protein [Alphaproteobacteria bacterium]|nr:DUF3108 domain-containing protein [Alphaproteobacteria bacterium]